MIFGSWLKLSIHNRNLTTLIFTSSGENVIRSLVYEQQSTPLINWTFSGNDDANWLFANSEIPDHFVLMFRVGDNQVLRFFLCNIVPNSFDCLIPSIFSNWAAEKNPIFFIRTINYCTNNGRFNLYNLDLIASRICAEKCGGFSKQRAPVKSRHFRYISEFSYPVRKWISKFANDIEKIDH